MDLSTESPNEDAPSERSEHLDLSGIDLLLQASKQTESKESNESAPESGIDLLIKASEVIKSKAIVTPTSGVSALLQAADMLESYTAETIRAITPAPRVPPSCAAQTDASSSTSVDVTVSSLERHLANIERDSKTNWLQDHSYIRLRPVYKAKGSVTTVFSDTRPVQVVMPTRRQDDEISAPSPNKKTCGESTNDSTRYSSDIQVNDETFSAKSSSPSNNRPVAVVKPFNYVPI